ncbi:MAG: LysR family transcriptional regulator [Pseudomonadota bacterium]
MSLLIEIRTAYFIAKLGTVSAAADALGVHRATVMRRIDLLEAELGLKIFRRHSKGYSLTDFGVSLVRSAETIEKEAERFVGLCKLTQERLEGEFIVATPQGSAPTVVAAVQEFQRRFPDVSVTHKVVKGIPRMELGEADICFYFGPKPEEPDYVVMPWMSFFGGIYAHQEYIDRNGNPASLPEARNHRFALLSDDLYSPPNDWIRENIPNENIVFTSNERHVIWRAVQEGMVIGCIGDHLAHANPLIHRIKIPVPNVKTVCWVITHVDTHRTPKVMAYLSCLKETGLSGKFDTEMDLEVMPQV